MSEERVTGPPIHLYHVLPGRYATCINVVIAVQQREPVSVYCYCKSYFSVINYTVIVVPIVLLVLSLAFYCLDTPLPLPDHPRLSMTGTAAKGLRLQRG